MSEIKMMLEEEIKSQIENLEYLENGSDEKASAIEDLVRLYKLKIEEEKIQLEFEDKRERLNEEIENHEQEEKLKKRQLDEQIIDRYFKVGIAAAEIMLPLLFYASWMRKGFKFEENGTFTSTTFRGLFNRFRPTKK